MRIRRALPLVFFCASLMGAQTFTQSVIHVFCQQGGTSCTDGEEPWNGPLMQAADGNLYGMTYLGGMTYTGTQSPGGVIFKLSLAGEYSVIYDFCSAANCTDGVYGYNGLIQGPDGNLYGAAGGGRNL